MNNIFLKFLADNNQEGIKALSKIIAISVRNNIEGFHVKYLSDSQMKELNPLIRKGVYEALFTMANLENNISCKKWFGLLTAYVPPYWEEPELDESLTKIRDRTLRKKTIKFKSEFLQKEVKIGNIFYNKITGCVEIKPSYKFRAITGDAHKHRNKISALLRKEGYIYMPNLYGYAEPQ